jgi:hypothetical protein
MASNVYKRRKNTSKSVMAAASDVVRANEQLGQLKAKLTQDDWDVIAATEAMKRVVKEKANDDRKRK